MKLYLGIELSISKTIIYAYNPNSKNKELVYNEPSCAILPNGNQNIYIFGNDCFKEEITGHFDFKSMYFSSNKEEIKKYLEHIFKAISEKLKDDLDINYIVINRYPNSNVLLDSLNDFISSNPNYKNIKFLSNDSIKLLNLNISNLLNIRKYPTSNILVLNLDDYSYDYSIFLYKEGSMIPQTDKLISNIKFDKISSQSLFSNIGLYSFILKMIDSSIKRNKPSFTKIYDNFIENNKDLYASQLIYKLIYELSKKISEGHLMFFKDKKYVLPISFKFNKRNDSLEFTYQDYNYALGEIIYSENGLRKSLKNEKNRLDKENIGYKLVPYGSFYNIIEVKALVNEIFGKDNILSFKELDNRDLISYDRFVDVALGAILSTTLTYEGEIPNINVITYLGYENEIMNDRKINKDKSELLLSTTLQGMPYYVTNKEYEIPLKTTLNDIEYEKNKSIIKISKLDNSNTYKSINLIDYLYKENNNTYRLLSLSNMTFQNDVILAKFRVGLIKNENNKPSIVFDLFNDEERYNQEIIIGLEEL